MSRDPNYYNLESEQYSQNRYEGVPKTYNQFMFQKRRTLLLELLSGVVRGKENLSLLDIACADGVLSRATDKAFPKKFSKIVGTDISKNMIEVAKNRFSDDSRFSFFIKNDCPQEYFDVVFGLGYMTSDIFDDEVGFLYKRLKPNGYYLCTLASTESLFFKFKGKDRSHNKTYKDYKNMIGKCFEIIEEVPYGLFIPKLWEFPFIARLAQPVLEKIFRNTFPNLFHEKIYLLRKK